MKRRDFLITTGTGAIALAAGPALAEEQKPLSPLEWTDQHSLTKHLVKDSAPLENEFEKFPRCPYCGMMRRAYSHSRHLIVYDDDMVDGTCSIHCAAISLSLNMDRGPKAIYAGDAGAADEIKPLFDVATGTYVIDPTKPGTMSAVSKFAYADKAKADEAAANGAEQTDFDGALKLAYAEMADATIMIRKRRAERRAKEKAAAGN